MDIQNNSESQKFISRESLSFQEKAYMELVARVHAEYPHITPSEQVFDLPVESFTGTGNIKKGDKRGGLFVRTLDTNYDVLTLPNPKGERLIFLRLGQNSLIVPLDDRTAIATTFLSGCTGIAYQFLRNTDGKPFFGASHYNWDPVESTSELLAETSKDYKLAALTMIIRPGAKRTENFHRDILEVCRTKGMQPLEVAKPLYSDDSLGILVTNRGGFRFTDTQNKTEKRNLILDKWTWKPVV